MKQLTFIFALILGFTVTSCKKDNPTPPNPPEKATYNDFVVLTPAQAMDSIVIVNATAGTTEHVTSVVTTINCGMGDNTLSTFNLVNEPTTGDVVTVTIYHNSYTFGGLSLPYALTNPSLTTCDWLGGQSGEQSSAGTSTTFTFTVS